MCLFDRIRWYFCRCWDTFSVTCLSKPTTLQENKSKYLLKKNDTDLLLSSEKKGTKNKQENLHNLLQCSFFAPLTWVSLVFGVWYVELVADSLSIQRKGLSHCVVKKTPPRTDSGGRRTTRKSEPRKNNRHVCHSLRFKSREMKVLETNTLRWLSDTNLNTPAHHLLFIWWLQQTHFVTDTCFLVNSLIIYVLLTVNTKKAFNSYWFILRANRSQKSIWSSI